MPIIEKSCTKCGETKPLTEFYTDRRACDGKTSWCKVCQRLVTHPPGTHRSRKGQPYMGNHDKAEATVCLRCTLDPDACLAETETRCPFATSQRQAHLCRDREWLYTEYIAKGRSAADIAQEVGLREAGVRHWVKKHGFNRNRVTKERREQANS